MHNLANHQPTDWQDWHITFSSCRVDYDDSQQFWMNSFCPYFNGIIFDDNGDICSPIMLWEFFQPLGICSDLCMHVCLMSYCGQQSVRTVLGFFAHRTDSVFCYLLSGSVALIHPSCFDQRLFLFRVTEVLEPIPAVICQEAVASPWQSTHTNHYPTQTTTLPWTLLFLHFDFRDLTDQFSVQKEHFPLRRNKLRSYFSFS